MSAGSADRGTPRDGASRPDPAAGAAGAGGTTRPVPRLVLGEPFEGVAGEDRPEAWGDRAASDEQRLAEYRRNTPPHHG